MATDSAVRSVTNTFTATTADTVTLLQPWNSVQITNQDGTNALYFRQDGVTAVAAADGTSVVPPGQSVIASTTLNQNQSTGVTTTTISLVGNGGGYTVEGVN